MNSELGVLIIEDDFRVAQINQQFVEQVSGFEVVALAQTRAQATQLLDEIAASVHLVLLDAYLPDVEGLSLLWELRQRWPQLDIVMVTAAQEVETIQEALRGGVFDYLIKPLMAERVQQTLQRYKNTRITMTNHTTLDQASLDAALRLPQEVMTPSRLPKNIDGLTLDKIRQCLHRESSPQSAFQIGSAAGVSRSTARRYLEYLVATEEACAELAYGDIGRPERQYSLCCQSG